MKTIKLTFLLALSVFFVTTAFAGDTTEVKKADSTEMKSKTDSTETKGKMTEEPEVKVTESGVKYQELVLGEGKECKIGSRVDCHYTLWFGDKDGNKIKRFQSSKDYGKSFQCTLGQGLIKGWSDGMVGMKEGGTRRLIISPELGYGKGGRGIPPDQWLVFEIEYLKHL